MSAEQDLKMTTEVDNGKRSTRAQKVSQAVELMNQLASDMKNIPSKIDWSGAASDAAQQSFATYAARVTEHADTLASVNAADATASAAVKTAQQNYKALPPGATSDAEIDAANKAHAFNPASPDAATMNAERQQRAEEYKQELDSSMSGADGDLKSHVTFDFEGPQQDRRTGSGGGGGGSVPATGGYPTGTMPGGGPNQGYTSVWGQGPQTPGYYNPTTSGPEYVGPTGPYGPTGPRPAVPLPTGNGPVNVDGPTTGIVPGGSGGSGGGLGGLGGLGSGGSGGSGSGGLGGLAGAGGVMAGGAGVAAGVGALRSGGGMGGTAGGRFGGGSAAADGGVNGRTGTGTGTGGAGARGAGGVSEGTAAGTAGGRPAGGMMGGGGGAGGGGRAGGGISGASSGKYGVPKLDSEGGAGGAGGRGGAGGSAGGAAGGRGGGGGAGGGDLKTRDRQFLTEEDEENWYDGVVDDE